MKEAIQNTVLRDYQKAMSTYVSQPVPNVRIAVDLRQHETDVHLECQMIRQQSEKRLQKIKDEIRARVPEQEGHLMASCTPRAARSCTPTSSSSLILRSNTKVLRKAQTEKSVFKNERIRDFDKVAGS